MRDDHGCIWVNASRSRLRWLPYEPVEQDFNNGHTRWYQKHLLSCHKRGTVDTRKIPTQIVGGFVELLKPKLTLTISLALILVIFYSSNVERLKSKHIETFDDKFVPKSYLSMHSIEGIVPRTGKLVRSADHNIVRTQ